MSNIIGKVKEVFVLKEIKKGNEQAFNLLIDEYKIIIYKTAMEILKNKRTFEPKEIKRCLI